MKKVIFSLFFIGFLSFGLIAQNGLKPDTNVTVKSTDPSGLIVMFMEDTWKLSSFANGIRNKEEGALTEAQFEYFKKNATWVNAETNFYDDFFSYFRSTDRKIAELFLAGWKSLKVYYMDMMTTYKPPETHYFHVLIVPAAENADWVFKAGKKANEVRIKQDIYLIFNAESLEVVFN